MTFIKNNLFLVIFFTLLLSIGLFLRLYHLGTPSLWIDEGFSINAAQATLKNGYPLLDSGELYSNSSLTIYTIAGMMSLFPLDPFNPWQTRLPAVVFGIGTIILGFMVARLLFKDTVLAALASVVLTFSYWQITWSREARGYAALQFFALLAVYFLLRWQINNKFKYLLLVALSIIGAYLSHGLGIVFVPALGLAVIEYWIFNPAHRPRIRNLVIGGIIIAIPLGFYLFPQLGDINHTNYSPMYMRYLFGALAVFAWGTCIGLLLGIFDKQRFWPITYLGIMLIIPLFIIMKFGPVFQTRYLFPLFPYLIFLTLYAVMRVIEYIPHLPKLYRNILFIGIVLLITHQSLVFIPKPLYQPEFDSPKPNFKAAYAYAKNNSTTENIIISSYAMFNNIYLGEKGYWLPISLTGKPAELDRVYKLGKDYYVGAPIIYSPEELKGLIANNHGFIIVDGMTRIRISQLLPTLQKNPKVTQVLHSGKGLNELWLFKF